MKIEVTFSGQLTVQPAYAGETFDHDEEVERAFDGTMNELVLLGAEDASVTGSLTSGEVEITLSVEAASIVEALPLADSTVRAAFQAAGVHTPGWEVVPAGLRVHWSHAEVGEVEETDVSACA